MLIHSYKVEVMKLKTTKLKLELDLIKNPSNSRALFILNKTNEQIEWFEKQIREGKDPGVRIS